jgi:hypothetical protein
LFFPSFFLTASAPQTIFVANDSKGQGENLTEVPITERRKTVGAAVTYIPQQTIG